MACCDCFVSLHRSEGFGLPIAETMALGKAVIVTQWSGNVDFTDESCAACVDYRIQPLGEDYGPYEARQQWAEPNIETAARWMRDLSDDSALARRLGAAGERKISETLSDKSVGDIIRARLGQIAGERLAPRGGNRPSESTDRIRAADD
jgi:glycosyltransferase involved in cell wall biosynthesis